MRYIFTGGSTGELCAHGRKYKIYPPNRMQDTVLGVMSGWGGFRTSSTTPMAAGHDERSSGYGPVKVGISVVRGTKG